jgi:hypothetical protein
MFDFTPKKSRTAPPILLGGIRRGGRRPLYGHLTIAFGGKRDGAVIEKIGQKIVRTIK